MIPARSLLHGEAHNVSLRVRLAKIVFAYPKLLMYQRFAPNSGGYEEVRWGSSPDGNGHHFAMKTLDAEGRTLRVVAKP
jgi:hypothetical protein